MTAINLGAERAVGPSVPTWLRLEGAAALIAGLVAYNRLGGEWLFAVPLLLLPDLSMAGYLAGPRIGSAVYNAAHNWATGLAVFGAGLALGNGALAIVGAILIAHTGGDRLFGYGLKLPTSFQDTHLGRIGRR
jgi:Domain of unknown function (DUF4260)